MSNSTYLGYPEIVWTAWEAIGTVSAVIFTLIILFIQKMRAYLFSPNITASDPQIKYQRPQSHTGRRGTIQLNWNIQNKTRLHFFGSIAVNVITRYWFDKKEHEGWTYSGNIRPLPILPKTEKWKQHTEHLEGEIEETEYTLILVFYQTSLKEKDREDVIGYAEFDIPYKETILYEEKIITI